MRRLKPVKLFSLAFASRKFIIDWIQSDFVNDLINKARKKRIPRIWKDRNKILVFENPIMPAFPLSEGMARSSKVTSIPSASPKIRLARNKRIALFVFISLIRILQIFLSIGTALIYYRILLMQQKRILIPNIYCTARWILPVIITTQP